MPLCDPEIMIEAMKDDDDFVDAGLANVEILTVKDEDQLERHLSYEMEHAPR